MDIEAEIIGFKMDLLRKMPFYGDIVMRLPFVANDKISTARTDGGKIEYNPAFLANMKRGQRNFVLMHEVFHVLLFHCKRNCERNPRLWNTAADMIVNDMLLQLVQKMNSVGIPFERPGTGIFASVTPGDTVENLYEELRLHNQRMNKNSQKVLVRLSRYCGSDSFSEIDAPDDILMPSGESDELSASAVGSGNRESDSLSEAALLQLIRQSASQNRSDLGTCFLPREILALVESKHIRWQTLLRDFFTEVQSDEASYTTPERKYIHMDLILPGYSLNDEKIEEIWAFVDSSGSIGQNEMQEFLTQLYRISKEFKCVFHICYWDTQVTDVYKKILRKEDILKSLPKHSGGTDINCVYRWLKENRVKPDIMLILTDGYFGMLDRTLYVPSLAKKTILVLSGSVVVSEEMKRLGRITRLN